MPPRRSDPKSRVDAGADREMRKLDESLASLRSAAREYAARRGRSNVVRLSAERRRADLADELVAPVPETKRPFAKRVVARLRAIAQKLLGWWSQA